ncbi:hypothetical protein BD408DRAFT_408809 [Parasitella parasitica]|nr:hypothetical protein BD408DRAFT_408809 [Parasitella parasitica]
MATNKHNHTLVFIMMCSIRALFGADGSQNATHGSDSQESADREIALIFDNDDSTEKAASHVPETHGLVDEVDAHGACKPETASGAEDENQQNQSYLPEVIKTPDFGYNNDTKNVADANVETTVNIDHLQTADVVSSEEHIIDLSQKDDVQAFNVIPEKTVEAPAIIEQKEAVPTYQGVVSLDATIDVTLQETAAVTNVAQPDATTSSTDILSNIKEDATSPNDTKQAEANFEPIENTPILEQQEVIEHETVTLDSVDLEQESKTKNLEAIIHYESKTVDIEAKPNVDQEPIDAVQDTEEAKNLHENDVVVEAPVAIATATETSQDTSKLDVEESIVDSGNVDEQAKQDESANDTSAIINQSNETSKECVTTDNVVCAVIDINAATTIAVTNQGDDESAVVSGVTFEENEVQADVVVHNDEKNPTAVTTIEHADIVQDVKSVECVIQENGAEEV